MKASDLFVECLEREGVEYIFGVPGEENADVMISLLDSTITFVTCRHEQAASFMADVYGRLTGRAAVCLGTLGPGATNLVTGVADANMDRAPLVAVTGQADLRRLHKESHQNMDVINMFRPLTKWTTSVQHPDNIPEVVRKAFKLAEAEKPGACHIELPEDVAKMNSANVPISPKKTRRPAPDHKAIEQALALIRAAERPIVLAGNGCVRKRAKRQLDRFVEKTGIFVANTFMGKGAISWANSHCLGTIGLQSRDHVSGAFERADLVIAIGYDLVEYHPSLWNKANHAKIIHIDFLPAEVDENYRVEVEVVADVAYSLWAINEQLEEAPIEASSFGRIRRDIVEDLESEKNDEGFPIKPQKILYDCRKVLGPSDILLSDVGAHKMWIARYYNCFEPNTCLISNGFCSMGFALPGAIAAKLVHPDRRVLAICGDGGFLMNVQDLETAARLGVNPVIMIWEDKKYGLIEWKQLNRYGRSSHIDFNNPDFVKLAEAFGLPGYQVTSADELEPILEKAFAIKDRPAIIAVAVDYAENMKLTRRLGELQASL